MPRRKQHLEVHRSSRVGWLRAAVLGAQDGIVSTAGLLVGVAASGASAQTVLTSGVAGVVAGAMSMAAGEYVSVQSQADVEDADLKVERRELADNPRSEMLELTGIYTKRGLSPALARRVAEELSAANALEAHARDELGITEALRARPLQAAFASAAAFAVGSALPLGATLFAPTGKIELVTTITTLGALLLTGGVAARAGGASVARGALRVVFWERSPCSRPRSSAACSTSRCSERVQRVCASCMTRGQ